MAVNDKMVVTKFVMERENRLAREAGEEEPYPNTETGLKKFYKDLEKTPTVQAYMKKHNLTKFP